MKKRILRVGFVAGKTIDDNEEVGRVVLVVQELVASLEKHGFRLTRMVNVEIEKAS